MANLKRNTPSSPRHLRSIILSVLVITLLVSNSVLAENDQAQELNKSHSDEHEWHKNHVAVFVGDMSPVNKSNDTSLALGISYERRLTKMFGLEALADFTVGSHERTALFAAGVTFRPFGGLKLMTGPGFEIEDPDNAHHSSVNPRRVPSGSHQRPNESHSTSVDFIATVHTPRYS
ncbi:MAG: hypothetical protein ABFS02_12310 [Pseudomonadota bacterium]